MKRSYLIAAAVITASVTLMTAAWLYLFSSSRSLNFARLRGNEQFNVIVVTLDTTRADRLGAYGFDGVRTPVIDSLAREGILFQRAYAVTPLTLPSHTSLFSGTYPPHHGVRDNGGFIVPDEITTLAEIYKSSGYETAGFVAAYVLDARWGLDQGFDTYVDDFDVKGQRFIAMGGVQRPANEVIDKALEWMGQERSAPFFLWVHLYDPHAPYEAPEPYKSRYPGAPYLAEIAFTDNQVGRLIEALEMTGKKDSTFIVVAADHGESLGEHGEIQHGFFIYESATHVPLIISTPFEEIAGVQTNEVVSLIDVMPTILDMTGFEIPEAVQGQSLTSLFLEGAASEPRFVYSETFYARYHYGWSELTAIQDERYKLIMSPDPELYDLAEDPGETINLAVTEKDLYERLETTADQFIDEISEGGTSGEFMAVDEETLAKLASLGYIGSFVPTEEGSADELASPREKIGIYNKSIQARQRMHTEKYEEAEELLQEIIDEDPRVLDAYQSMAQLYDLQERFDEAVEVYKQAIPLKPEDPYAYINLAETQIKLGRVEEAEKTALDALDFVEPNAYIYYLLGNVNRMQGRLPESLTYYEKCLEVNPDSAVAYSGLAGAYFELDDLQAAEQNARKALSLDDSVPSMHFTLASIHEAEGDLQQAAAEYLKEIEVTPEDIGSHFNLAMIYRVVGRVAEEERQLQRVLEINPEYPRGLLFMARIYLNRGENYARAVEMVTAAVAEPLETQDLALGYFLLADLHNRLGDPVKSREYAAKAQSLVSRSP